MQFIDTTKFSQQSLASLGDSMTETERKNVQDTCQNFLREKLIFLTENDEKWVLHYLVSGKGTILYQIITDFDSLKRNSEEFSSYEDFYSDLKEKTSVKKSMRML